MSNDTLALVIQSLSILLIGGVSWFLRELYKDIQIIRTELTVLKTEHDMYKEMSICPMIKKDAH